jgi:hypothetical protein
VLLQNTICSSFNENRNRDLTGGCSGCCYKILFEVISIKIGIVILLVVVVGDATRYYL